MDVLNSPKALRRWAVANLVANMVIVWTGALVRLTASGLGCSTWPQCDPGSYVPHPEAPFHAFTGQAERRIDWVLSRGLRAIRARTLTDNSAGRYPSDHFPVLVDFDWPESPL